MVRKIPLPRYFKAAMGLGLKQDDKNLFKLREFSKQMLEKLRIDSGDRILEIGPNRLVGAKNSPVFEKHPTTFFDLSSRCPEEDFSYFDLDIDPEVSPSFLGDISSAALSLPVNYFDKIICFSVLEHVFDIRTAIDNLQAALKPGGDCHIITPWDLRFHGPRPDCWRISDDAYRLLLEPIFDEVSIHQIPNSRRPLSPVGLYVVATK